MSQKEIALTHSDINMIIKNVFVDEGLSSESIEYNLKNNWQNEISTIIILKLEQLIERQTNIEI